jgi:hypothetical protein
MITLKGRVASFTGKDAKNLKDLAKSLGVTPQKAVVRALEYYMALKSSSTKKTKRSK